MLLSPLSEVSNTETANDIKNATVVDSFRLVLWPTPHLHHLLHLFHLLFPSLRPC
jgi:hypothetical protein